MKCSQDAVLQAAAVLTAAKISNGLAEVGAGSGPDVGQTLALSIIDILDGINEFNLSEQGAALRTWDDSAS
jgi:hypothetical protein